jgi:hypothetical protein
MESVGSTFSQSKYAKISRVINVTVRSPQSPQFPHGSIDPIGMESVGSKFSLFQRKYAKISRVITDKKEKENCPHIKRNSDGIGCKVMPS